MHNLSIDAGRCYVLGRYGHIVWTSLEEQKTQTAEIGTVPYQHLSITDLLSWENTKLPIARCDLLPRVLICSPLPIDLISPMDLIHRAHQFISVAPDIFFKLCGLKHLFHKPVKLAWTSEFSLKWSYSCALLLMHYLGVNRWHSLNFNNENTLVSFNPFYRWCLRWNFLWWKKKGNNLSFNAQTESLFT